MAECLRVLGFESLTTATQHNTIHSYLGNTGCSVVPILGSITMAYGVNSKLRLKSSMKRLSNPISF